MFYERAGYRYGAWVIRLGEHSAVIEAGGDQSFPELDGLYVPKEPDPKHWYDYYSNRLVPDAEERLLSMLRSSPRESSLTDEMDGLAPLIARTKWKFAWSYARTYPHEYTTKALCSPEDHARLIDCIERYGVIERFINSRRKYFYFEERKYWHMGEPQSEDPGGISTTVRSFSASIAGRWVSKRHACSRPLRD